MSFNSSHVVVRGHAVNNVEGNQVNTSQTITAEVVHINGHREKERTEYDEFEEVKRGHIVTLERLHTEDLSNRELEWELKDGELVHKPARSTKRSICTVQVRPDQQTKYTAVVYDGEDSHVWWKDDFERFSRAGLGAPDTWQLYGLNRSKVPLLIFHDEMVPLASFYKESFWGDFYVYMLREHLRCLSWQIWLNMRGNLCKGLDGPHIYIKPRGQELGFRIIVPSSARMLQDDICFEFFQQQAFSSQLQQCVLGYAYWHLKQTCLDDLFPGPTNHRLPSDWTIRDRCKGLFWNRPHHLSLDVINGLRLDTVYSPSRGAVARWPRDKGLWVTNKDPRGLVNETELGDRLIRFKLGDPGNVWVSIEYAREDFHTSWLMQSPRIIDAHEMSGMEEKYFVVCPPDFLLSPSHLNNQKPRLTLEKLPSIYLFIYTPPLSISELISWENGDTRSYFWSLDENGRSEMSAEECRRLGVPELAHSLTGHRVHLISWPTNVYTALRKWQVVAPTTASQSRGYLDLEIVGGKKEEARFEGIRDWCSYRSKVREQAVELQLCTSVQVQEIETTGELPLTTLTPKSSRIPVPKWNPRRKSWRESISSSEDSQVGHIEEAARHVKETDDDTH